MQTMNYLASEQTSIGMIILQTREHARKPGTFITELMIDHMLLMSSHNLASEEALSLSALELHSQGDGLRVMVGGLGLGHTADALLRSDRVASVEVVEFLQPIIDWWGRGMMPMSAKLKDDARLTVAQGDVYGRLAGPPADKFDLILVDVDHSPDEPLGEESAQFYTDEGLLRAKAHLAPGGVLGLWSYADNGALRDTMKRVFAHGQVECVEFTDVLSEEKETNYLFFGWD